jgi:8-amino-7-oxononanoate synthase
MDGDIANIPELVRLKKQYGAVLMVDDAHSVGVLGADGSGTAAHYHLQGQVDIQVGTLSKALASEGGYVAASQVIIDYLRNKSRPFIFSTFLSPADIAAALAALKSFTNGRP